MPTLTDNQKHILRLSKRGANDAGWAPVSKPVWPLLADIPDELLEKAPSDSGGHVRLTTKGKTILDYI